MDFIMNKMVGFHATLFRITGGRFGRKMGGQSVLLLHSTGRKSGKAYANMLSYYRDGGNYLVVGSNWGRENDPDWYLNLMANPQTEIQVEEKTISVEASAAEGAEYERLWDFVSARNRYYPQKQKELARQIPIVILTPDGG